MNTFIKFLVTGLLALTTLLASQAAFADKGKHYSKHGYGGYAKKYDRHYDRHRHANKHRRHHRYDRRDRDAYLIGGLVLGSVLTHIYHNSQEPVVNRRVYSEPAVDRTRYSRRLFRDRYGNCYERSYSPYGDEVLSELAAEECGW